MTLLATLLIAFLAIQLVPAFLPRRREGAGLNQYIGMMWALGLLLRARLSAGVLEPTGDGCGPGRLLATAALVLAAPLHASLGRPGVVEYAAVPRSGVKSINPAVISYARSHLVFDTALGVVSPTLTHEEWPHQANLMDVLAAGEPEDYVVNALIARRFDAVTTFEALGSGYVAQAGLTSAEYLPALNALIRRGYVAGANGAPAPLLGRRPGDIDLSWAQHCFSDANPLACMRAGT